VIAQVSAALRTHPASYQSCCIFLSLSSPLPALKHRPVLFFWSGAHWDTHAFFLPPPLARPLGAASERAASGRKCCQRARALQILLFGRERDALLSLLLFQELLSAVRALLYRARDGRWLICFVRQKHQEEAASCVAPASSKNLRRRGFDSFLMSLNGFYALVRDLRLYMSD
jgi:hypothetical protein